MNVDFASIVQQRLNDSYDLGADYSVPAEHVYADYIANAIQNNHPRLSRTMFGMLFPQIANVRVSRDANGVTYHGLRLKPSGEKHSAWRTSIVLAAMKYMKRDFADIPVTDYP